MEALALALQAGLMLQYAPAVNAQAFIAARLSDAGGLAYGTLPAGTDCKKIIERAWPPDDSDLSLTFTIGDRAVPYLDGLVYPAVSTVAGQPATAFPVGRSHDGLPIGLQAIGPYLEDRTPIRFAALLAGEIGGFSRPEGYE